MYVLLPELCECPCLYLASQPSWGCQFRHLWELKDVAKNRIACHILETGRDLRTT